MQKGGKRKENAKRGEGKGSGIDKGGMQKVNDQMQVGAKEAEKGNLEGGREEEEENKGKEEKKTMMK